MVLTPAQKQKRYREKLNADAIEAALLLEVERCERGELADRERIALADKLADTAINSMRRSHRLAQLAHKVRLGGMSPATGK
jgi:hypothetical protein